MGYNNPHLRHLILTGISSYPQKMKGDSRGQEPKRTTSIGIANLEIIHGVCALYCVSPFSCILGIFRAFWREYDPIDSSACRTMCQARVSTSLISRLKEEHSSFYELRKKTAPNVGALLGRHIPCTLPGPPRSYRVIKGPIVATEPAPGELETSWCAFTHRNRTALDLLYTSLCTGKLNAIRKQKCFLCSPFYRGACRWAML